MSTKSPLRTLVDILSDAVNHIESQYAAAGLKMPSLDAAFDSANLACTFLSHPDVIEQASVVVAAAEQLAVSVRPPRMVILENVLAVSFLVCCSVRRELTVCSITGHLVSTRLKQAMLQKFSATQVHR